MEDGNKWLELKSRKAQSKRKSEAHAISRPTIKAHFERNQDILLNLSPPIGKLMPDGSFVISPEDRKRMWNTDEKGHTLANISQVHTLSAVADKQPVAAVPHDLDHITTCPFNCADGSTTKKQAIVHTGSLYHPDMNKGFPNAVVVVTKNGSMEAEPFVQVFKEVL